MKNTHLPIGSSDPVSFKCTCPASESNDGLVLLFYRYFDAPPRLPTPNHGQPGDTSSIAAFHATLTQTLGLGGKIRISKEGFNVTVGGTKDAVEEYMQECQNHWSFAGLDLSTAEIRDQFFKPSPGGCACVFGGCPASVRVTSEITPMGVTNYTPAKWDGIESLSPEDFHKKCHSDPEILLLDVRNHYESRIGYFVHPKTGEPALRPPIRRFSQWPQYVRKQISRSSELQEPATRRHIMTYCTGGIRCEKGARFLQENVEQRDGDKVCTLKGGIAAYLTWIDGEIAVGKKSSEDSLFRGRNYVFDARGSTGLNSGAATNPVSKCHVCGSLSDRLSKCRSTACHLVLVVCDKCELGDPRCCHSCLESDTRVLSDAEIRESRPRPICACEKEREDGLWGPGCERAPKSQGWRKAKKAGKVTTGISIQVRTID
ncbi:hypothetical protein QTJ16_005222 [Diplocarpon rosae]|uniref:Rhodanese domain-containing protein n=1 Tax=Diplocarpon rosae TaxID=946125 RepID=A0AAD9T0A0_9HELO|nr:hypothetical protein QTJ16_005222 [Diplocarpon rosae]